MTTRHTGKNIKIFLSSTFRDMDAERDAIMNRVYPAVAQQLAPHNIHVDFIDLRWGVSTSDVDEAERENHVLRECIDGIQSSRPFFIGLLGDRYGWVPSQESWDAIVGGMTNDEMQFINSDTAQARSVTELEILFGSLMDTDNLHRSFFCFRSPEAYKDMDNAHRALYCEQGDEATRRLKLLKEKITSTMHAHSLDRNICQYGCRWNGQHLTQLDTLVEFLTTALVQEIMLYECEDATANPDNAYEAIYDKAQEQITQSNQLFCGREGWLQWLTNYIDDENNKGKVLLMTGMYGFGKTALLCKLYEELEQKDGYEPYIYFADRRNTNCRPEMPLKCWLADQRTESDHRCGIETDEDFGLLAHLLAKAFETNSKKKVLMVDEVCLLDNCNTLLDNSWVPDDAVVICTSEISQTEGIDICDKIQITALNEEEVQQLVDKRLAKVGKHLQPAVMKALLEKTEGKIKPSAIPLWSVMMARHLTLLNASYFDAQRQRTEADDEMKIQNSLIEIIEQANGYPETLFMSIVAGADLFVDLDFCIDVLRLLAVSEFGLRESDLHNLLGQKWDALKWAETRRYLGPLLNVHDENGIIDFTYPNFRSELCIQAGDNLGPYLVALADYMHHIVANNSLDLVANRELPYIALKTQSTELLDLVVMSRGHMFRRSVVYALADVAVRRPKFLEQWVTKATARRPIQTAWLLLDVMKQLANSGNTSAAASIGSAVIKIYRENEETWKNGGQKPQDGNDQQAQDGNDQQAQKGEDLQAQADERHLVEGCLTAFFAVCLYKTGDKKNAEQWANHLINAYMPHIEDDRYMEVFAWAIYVATCVWRDNVVDGHEEENATSADVIVAWADHGLNFLQRLATDCQRLEFLEPEREMAQFYRAMTQQENENLPTNLLVANELNEQPWMYRAYFKTAPMMKMAGMMKYADRFVADTLTAEAKRLAATIQEAAPDNLLFMDACQPFTEQLEEDDYNNEALVVDMAEKLLFLNADQAQCAATLSRCPSLFDDNRTDAIGVRANLLMFCMELQPNDGSTRETAEVKAKLNDMVAYANKVIDAFFKTKDQDEKKAIANFLWMFISVMIKIEGLPASMLSNFAAHVFNSEYGIYMDHYEHPTVEQTLRLQVAFYMMSSMTEFAFRDIKNVGSNDEQEKGTQRAFSNMSLMKSLNLSGTLVVEGFSLIYNCMAYICEQKHDIKDMMFYNKQHEYATCEAWRLNPDDFETARRYAAAVDETGRRFYTVVGNFKEAVLCFEKANEMFVELFKQEKHSTILNDMLLSSYNIINILNAEHLYDLLCMKAEETLALVTDRMDDPDTDLGLVAAICESKGHALMMLKQFDEAWVWLNKAQKVYEDNLNKNSEDEKCMRDLAIIKCRIADYLMAKGSDADNIIAIVNEAEGLLKKALDIVPDSPKVAKNYIGLLSTKMKVYLLKRDINAADETLAQFEKLTLKHILNTRDTSLIQLMFAVYDSFIDTAVQSDWTQMANALLQVKQNAEKQLVENRLMKG